MEEEKKEEEEEIEEEEIEEEEGRTWDSPRIARLGRIRSSYCPGSAVLTATLTLSKSSRTSGTITRCCTTLPCWEEVGG